MPQIQVLPAAPGFGSQLGQALGGGISQGISASLQSFMEQKAQREKLENILGLLRPSATASTGQIPNASIAQASVPATSSFGNISPEQEFALNLYDPQAGAAISSVLGRQQKEQEIQRKIKTAGLTDTKKYREDLVEKATAARQAIRNKEYMLKKIEEGNLDDPLLVSVANFLPAGFREATLTNDSLAYEAAMFGDYGVLRQMFPGQIRVAELDILGPKLASLVKNNEVKKEINLKALEALKAEDIRAKVASKIEKEHPEYTLLQLQNAIDEESQPQLQKLYDGIEADLEKIVKKYLPASENFSVGQSFDTLPKASEMKGVTLTLPSGEDIKSDGKKWRKVK